MLGMHMCTVLKAAKLFLAFGVTRRLDSGGEPERNQQAVEVPDPPGLVVAVVSAHRLALHQHLSPDDLDLAHHAVPGNLQRRSGTQARAWGRGNALSRPLWVVTLPCQLAWLLLGLARLPRRLLHGHGVQ